MSDTKTRLTQTKMILDELKKGKGVTPKDAEKLCGCMRLAAIIHVLRKRGYPIVTNEKTSRNKIGGMSTYAEYVLDADWEKIMKR